MSATRAEKEWDVIAVGDVFVDLVMSGFPAWPRPGEEAFAKRLQREVGGGAAITACGLAKLGARVAVLAAVGEADGQWLIECLKAGEVETRHIRHHPSEPTGLTVSVSTAEDRAFFTYAGANRALPDLLGDRRARRELQRARHVHLACPVDPDRLAELAAALRAEGGCVSLDVGWQTAWLSDARSLRALREIDLFLPNEREAELMTGEKHPRAMLLAFLKAGLRGVALKRGVQGAMLLWHGEVFIAEPHLVKPVDTTGAGDCFDAGFISAWLRGEPPEVCLQTANLCGALSTQGLGGISAFPTRVELTELLTEA